jgi:hypothetical protein
MRSALFFVSLMLAGCGEPVEDDHFANDSGYAQATPEAARTAAMPVRIGELGPSFEACVGAGTTRHLETGGRLPVRSAPFESAAETGAIPAGARFFLCTRSLDQKWFGVVYDEAGALAPRCGVSDPVTSRRDYAGPCRSGWVSSAFVKLIAGNDAPPIPTVPIAAPGADAPSGR